MSITAKMRGSSWWIFGPTPSWIRCLLLFASINSLWCESTDGRKATFRTGSAEYFYANDKLADNDASQYVNSLLNSSTLRIQPYHQTRAYGSSHSRPSYSQPPTVSFVSRQGKFELSPTSSASSLSSLSSSSSSLTNAAFKPPTSSLHSQVVRSDVRTPSYKQRNLINEKRDSSDLSWLQPVYIGSNRTASLAPTSTDSIHHTLRIDALKNVINETVPVVRRTNQTVVSSRSLEQNKVMSSSSSSSATDNRWNNLTFTLKDEQWVAPIIALSLLNMMVIGAFECFVIYRACRLENAHKLLYISTQNNKIIIFQELSLKTPSIPRPNAVAGPVFVIRNGDHVCAKCQLAELYNNKGRFGRVLHSGVRHPSGKGSVSAFTAHWRLSFSRISSLIVVFHHFNTSGN